MIRRLFSILFLVVFAVGCSSSRTVTQDGETNWLRECQGEDECDVDLSCVCGLCTKSCERDDECNDLSTDLQCVSSEHFADADDCQENDQTEGGMCDLLCIEDDDCRALGDDAICQSGSCRWHKPGQNPDAPNQDGGDVDFDDGASRADSEADADVLEVTNATLSSLSEAEKKERRAQVISDYCDLIEQYPCLRWESVVGRLAVVGSIEEQKEFCEMELELRHYIGVHPDCHQQWEALYGCYARYEEYCPCNARQGECDAPVGATGNENEICSQERIAYDNCEFWRQNDQNFDVEGERATCSGHIKANDSGDCDIQCDISPDYYYWAECEGPAGGPVRCECSLNGELLIDAFTEQYYPIFESNCREATQAMADGVCMDIINCCISWIDSGGDEECECTADPSWSYYGGGETGARTCQQLADLIEGEVVDLCPKHAPIDWGDGTIILTPYAFPI